MHLSCVTSCRMTSGLDSASLRPRTAPPYPEPRPHAGTDTGSRNLSSVSLTQGSFPSRPDPIRRTRRESGKRTPWHARRHDLSAALIATKISPGAPSCREIAGGMGRAMADRSACRTRIRIRIRIRHGHPGPPLLAPPNHSPGVRLMYHVISYDSLIMLSITYETHNIRVMILPIDANPCWPRGLVTLSDRGQSGHDALSGTRDRAPPLPGAWPLACRARRLYATIAGRLTAQSRSQACLGPGVVMRPAASLPVSPFGYKIPAKSLLIACRALLESARRTSASL